MSKKKLERILISIFLLWCVALILRGVSILEKKPKVTDDNPYLVFCDVGQGDSAVLIVGNWQMIIDGGPDNGKALHCLDQHMPEGDSVIELMVITHPDLDHFGGLTAVWDSYLVEMVVTPPINKTTRSFTLLKEKILTAVAENKTRLVHCPEEMELNPKEGIRINFWDIYTQKYCQENNIETKENTDVISGEYFFVAEEEAESNNESVVTFLSVEGVRAAFLGDLEIDGEEQLVDEEGRVGVEKMEKMALLKIAHHGAKTATSQKMLQAWQPTKAVISVGGENSYGHPTKQTLERLMETGTQVYRTDERGNVIFRFFMGDWEEKIEEKSTPNLIEMVLELLK